MKLTKLKIDLKFNNHNIIRVSESQNVSKSEIVKNNKQHNNEMKMIRRGGVYVK